MDFTGEQYIGLHGGGEIYGFPKTNSREAFLKWYSKGLRFFEFDVSETVDGSFVAFAHRLNEGYLSQVELETPQGGCTSKWFSSAKLLPYSTQGLSTLSFEDIFSLMKRDASLQLMMDLYATTDNEIERFVKYIKKVTGNDSNLIGRCLIEIYNINSIEIVHNILPNISIIFVIQPDTSIWPRPLNNGFDIDILDALKLKHIKVLSFQWHYLDDYKEGIKCLINYGFIVLSHIESDIDIEVAQKEGVKILLVDYCYGNNRAVTHRLFVNLIRKRAKLKLIFNKFKRMGFCVAIHKALIRLK